MIFGINWSFLIMEFCKSFFGNSMRFLIFTLPVFLLLYVWKRREMLKYKIQQKFPENKHIIREITYSFLSIGIFSMVVTLIVVLKINGYTKIYTNLSDHSAAYFIFSVVAFIVLHDAYFYWTHRAMHLKPIYRHVHLIHHKSVDPTPWAAFAFHPIEAIVEIGIFPIMVFLMPLHLYAILTWVLYQTAMNLLGHLGFELFPAGFVSGAVSKWSNTSTHHNMHHKFVKCNYGLYFNFWDRIMNTNHVKYEEEFEKIKKRVKESSEQSSASGYREAAVS